MSQSTRNKKHILVSFIFSHLTNFIQSHHDFDRIHSLNQQVFYYYNCWFLCLTQRYQTESEMTLDLKKSLTPWVLVREGG